MIRGARPVGVSRGLTVAGVEISFSLLLVTLAAVCLMGAFWLPFMHAEFALALPPWIPRPIATRMREWLILKGRMPVGDHYLWGVIWNLFGAREYFVGWAILLFSVVFPISKITLGAVLIAGRHALSQATRRRLLRFLATTAKWSMADVFIVGMVIVFFKADGFHFTFTARPGIYCYAAAALLSSAAVSLIQRAHHVEREDDGQAIPDQDYLGR